MLEVAGLCMSVSYIHVHDNCTFLKYRDHYTPNVIVAVPRSTATTCMTYMYMYIYMYDIHAYVHVCMG